MREYVINKIPLYHEHIGKRSKIDVTEKETVATDDTEPKKL